VAVFVRATQNKFKDLYAARFGNDSFDNAAMLGAGPANSWAGLFERGRDACAGVPVAESAGGRCRRKKKKRKASKISRVIAKEMTAAQEGAGRRVNGPRRSRTWKAGGNQIRLECIRQEKPSMTSRASRTSSWNNLKAAEQAYGGLRLRPAPYSARGMAAKTHAHAVSV